MKRYYVILLILIWASIIAKSQSFNNAIGINATYLTDTVINPFSGNPMTGIGISGEIIFNSDTSFVRVIVDDGVNQFMVYEAYPMLQEDTTFDFNYECEETCFFDNYTPSNLILQINDASLFIDSINWSNIYYSNALNLQNNAKSNKNNEKLSAIINYINDNNLIWVAEETEFSKLYYSDKAKMWGNDYKSFGFEFYSYGFYSVFGPSSNSSVMNYGYADNFDWRNRHNSNMEDSPYYNAGGEGWITPVVCQGLGCWYNNEFLCNTSPSECDALGGIYRTAATCWIFGPTAHIEALTNLYYNEFINVDLSEQYIACEENTVGRNSIYNALKHYKNEGVPDEDCLHYSASLENCSDLCTSPSERIWIDNYTKYINPTDEETRQYLMEYGPVTAELIYFPWGTDGHSMALIGWGVIDEDALDVTGVGTPIDESWYGTTYWIFKESSGPGVLNNGFKYIIDWDINSNIYTIDRHIVSLNRNDDDVNCFDKDGDGYYFRGIGPKPDSCPLCPAKPDGDDSDPGLGPINEHGVCSIINTYNASFENSWNNWVQVGGDDLDWWRHEGPTETNNTGPEEAQDGDFYIYVMSNCNGCYPFKEAIIESPPINLSNFCEGQIDFHYHMDTYKWGNPVENELILQISYDNGATWENDFWSMSGDTGEEWQFASLKFPSTVTKFRFIAITGDTYMSEMALDNITIGPVPKNSQPLIISTDTQWNSDNTINSDVIIENGATLTISNCNISMHEQARIIIKNGDETTPGSKLVIDNATVNCQCNHALWQGIQVWGNTNTHQYTINDNCAQGQLFLKNNATIKNAYNAVTLWKPDSWDNRGGIIIARDSKFINNKRSVEFMAYQNHHPFNGKETDYISSFTNCDFIYDDDYRLSDNVKNHVTMWGVRGVEFKGCSFINNVASEPNTGYGIFSLDAGYRITDYCNAQVMPCPVSGIIRSTFKGLKYGIQSANVDKPLYHISVFNSDFTNNGYGIHLTSVYSPVIVNNNFELGAISENCDNLSGTGIYFDNSKAFAVENNDFTPFDGSIDADYLGIRVNNTNNAGDEIYNNDYNGLDVAIQSEGKNWNDKVITGLAYYCNDNQNNKADFYVKRHDYDDGIQILQGSDTRVAGNTFSPDADDKSNFYNESDYEIIYHYYQNGQNEEPVKHENVKVVAEQLTKVCPDHYSGGDIRMSSTDYQQRETDYNTATASYNNASSNYDNANDSATRAYWAGKMSYYNTERVRAAYDIIRSDMADTIANSDKFVEWMEKLDTYTTNEALVDYYMQQGDYTTALNKVDSLPYRFTFTAYDSVEYPMYHDFKHEQAAWLADGRTIFGLTTSEINSLITIADRSRGTAGAQARAILRFAYPSQYSYIDCYEGPGGSTKSARLNESSGENTDEFSVQVKPNPAGNTVTFSYTLPEGATTGIIELFDNTGKTVKRIKLTNDAARTINCAAMPSGIYYYRVTAGASSKTGKLMIQH